MAAAVEELPEELVTLILAKLPVKSLLRFKCVRKSWFSLIKSPHFIHLHRSYSSENWDCFIVKGSHQRNVLSFLSYETLDDLGNDISIPVSKNGGDHISTPISFSGGPCDGLVCITNHCDQIIICNPAIREFRSLLVPPSLGKSPDCRSIDSIAFGSDPNTADGQYYKLLMICSGLSPHELNREAKMYDFRTDTWRETQTAVVIPSPFGYRHQAISLNGVFHWCPDQGSSEENILTFHISDEVTGSIPLPDFLDLSLRKDLFVSSESQLALSFSSGRFGRRFEICVMTEYGVKESWTRLFQIEPLLNIFYPLASWGERQLLFPANWCRQLASPDLRHQNVRRFPIYGNLNVYPYSESLVSVHGIGGGELL